MCACGIGEVGGEEGHHNIQYPFINGCGCIVVEIYDLFIGIHLMVVKLGFVLRMASLDLNEAKQPPPPTPASGG